MSRDELIVLAGEQADRLAAQERQITALATLVADLMEASEQLTAKLERLEHLQSRNSGNSSLPPSMDDQPGRRPPEGKGPRTKSGGRSPGKQPGAPGSHLAWSQSPDEIIPHFPDGACACGAPVAGGWDLGVAASHQQVEIPLASAKVTQHDLHAVACRCGKVHQAARPEGVTGGPGTVSYGPALQALCVFLMVIHAIPVHRCAELIESLTGARPSPGFVHAMLARAAAAVADANKAIRALIILAHVVCADETPLRVGPGPKSRKRYLLVACTNLLTYYFLGDRSMATFRAFVLPDMTGVIVHDRYQNYDSAEFAGLVHQLCTQHLLRDLADAAERYPGSIWPGQIADALRGLIHAANTARRQGLSAIPAQIAAPLMHTFRHGVLAGLSEVPRRPGRKQHPCRDLLECLRDRQADVLRFVSDLRIPPTSNQAERDVRPAKTQQKISGRLRSEETTRHRYAIRGYLSTAAKHGADVLTVLRDAILGHPWMPPIPNHALTSAPSANRAA
jgi:transposase